MVEVAVVVYHAELLILTRGWYARLDKDFEVSGGGGGENETKMWLSIDRHTSDFIISHISVN
jgi:hypothetical protein